MPHFGELQQGLIATNLATDTSFVESHRVTVLVGGVAYYLPLMAVPAASVVLLEDGTFLLLEDGSSLLTE